MMPKILLLVLAATLISVAGADDNPYRNYRSKPVVPARLVPRSADVSMNGAYLTNSPTTKQLLKDRNEFGTEVLTRDEMNESFINCYYNRDQTELLAVAEADGGLIAFYEPTRFMVRPAEKTRWKHIPVLMQVSHFTTGKGIRLGMTITEVKNIFGTKCLEIEEKEGFTILKYEMGEGRTCTGPVSMKFLDYFDDDHYYSSYYFLDQKLVKFDFGISIGC